MGVRDRHAQRAEDIRQRLRVPRRVRLVRPAGVGPRGVLLEMRRRRDVYRDIRERAGRRLRSRHGASIHVFVCLQRRADHREHRGRSAAQARTHMKTAEPRRAIVLYGRFLLASVPLCVTAQTAGPHISPASKQERSDRRLEDLGRIVRADQSLASPGQTVSEGLTLSAVRRIFDRASPVGRICCVARHSTCPSTPSHRAPCSYARLDS